MSIALGVAGLLALSFPVQAEDFAKARLGNWHQWRGPNADGLVPDADPPVEWSESKNVKWKVEIPGSGASTPIVWGDKVFILTAVKTGEKPKAAAPPRPPSRRRGRFRMSTGRPDSAYAFDVLCLDRRTGRTVWKKTALKERPHEGHHPSHGFASASPTTDGRYLYASFGSRGIFCYDLDGDLKWKKDLGDMTTKVGFGEGVSPVFHGDSLIVNWDHEGRSFIVRLDSRTGEEKWRTARDERTTWSTPLVVEEKGVTQVVVHGQNRVRGYDFETGKVLWACGGQTGNPIPMPVVKDGTVYCMSGFRGFALYAIPLSARGEVGGGGVAWRKTDAAPYVASPLIYGDLLYFTKERQGILSCVDAKTGEVRFGATRLPGVGTLYASLVGAAGRVYVSDRSGTTLVLEHGPAFKVLATNELDEGVNASPAIVGNQLFLRGFKHLYCIASE